MSVQSFTDNRAAFSSIDLRVTQKPRFVPNLYDVDICGEAAPPHTVHSANPPPCPVKARKAFLKERRGCNTQEKRPELLVKPSTGRKVNCCLCWTDELCWTQMNRVTSTSAACTICMWCQCSLLCSGASKLLVKCQSLMFIPFSKLSERSLHFVIEKEGSYSN